MKRLFKKTPSSLAYVAVIIKSLIKELHSNYLIITLKAQRRDQMATNDVIYEDDQDLLVQKTVTATAIVSSLWQHSAAWGEVDHL